MRFAFLAAILVLAAVAVLGPETKSSLAGPNCAVDATIDSEEQEFLRLINQHRQQNGLRPLQLSDTLNRAAAWKSQHLADYGYFAHDDTPIGRTWVQRLRDCGYSYNTWLGENIAAGNATAAGVFDQWRSSPGHNANMLSGNFNAIGIGRAYSATSPHGWYWTTDFGGVSDGYTPPPPPSPTPSPTATASPSPTATTPPTPAGPDSDGDGCSDDAELGPSPGRGGQRDPASPWDFFDTPDENNLRDAEVTGADLFRVLGRFGTTDNEGRATISRASDLFSPPPATGYHPAFDRGDVVGPHAWNRGPADGAVTASDIFALVAQFGHSCR